MLSNRNCHLVFLLLLFFIMNISSAALAKDVKLYQVSSGVLKFDKGWLTAMKDVGKILEIKINKSNRNTLFGKMIDNLDQKVA